MSSANATVSRQPGREKSQLELKVRRLFRAREMVLLLIVLVEIIAVAVASPAFLDPSNLKATSVSLSWDMIIAVGMTMILVAGAFDLSIGSVLAVSGILVGIMVRDGVAIPVAIAVSLIAALAFGVANSVLITKIKINPLIATLGTMAMGRGLALVIASGSPIMSIPPAFVALASAEPLGVPIPIWIMLVLVVIGDQLLRKSAFFRQLYFVGGNEKAALLSGINVNQMKWVVFVGTAFLAGLAGILETSYHTVGLPTAGMGAEFRVIAACVIGGCSLRGGVGTVLGSLLGMVFVAVVANAMVMLNVSVFVQQLVTGLVLLTAVVIDNLTHK